jgi:hypothetical protein
VEFLEKNKSALGDLHPDTLTSINKLAMLYYNQGKYEKAVPLYVETVPIAKRVLGDSHSTTVTMERNLLHVVSKMQKK